MKLKDIKTREQFHAFADSWYQRTHSLRRYYEDESKDELKRKKAFELWVVMFRRVMVLTQIATKINQVKPKFKKGSIND